MTPSISDAPTVRVAGYPFVTATFADVVERFVATCASSSGGLPVRLANAYSVATASTDPQYAAVLAGPGVNLPDGTPVAVVARFKSRRATRAERVRGPSFFTAVLERGQSAGLRHFLLGTTDETLEALRDSVAARYPGAVIAGTWAPPFGPLDDAFGQDAVQRIRAAAPHVVWVGLGTPKQDIAAAMLADEVGVPLVGVGAAFDFVAGTIAEPPVWVQRSGFEWLYRLFEEPKRLWRRYLIGNVQFLVALARAEVRDRRAARRDVRSTSSRASDELASTRRAAH